MSEPPKTGTINGRKTTNGNKDDLTVKPRSSTEDEEYDGDVEPEASDVEMPDCVSDNDAGIETPTEEGLATPALEAEDALLDAVEDLFGEFDWNLPTDDEVNI